MTGAVNRLEGAHLIQTGSASSGNAELPSETINAMLTCNVEVKPNPSDPEFNLVCAILQQVTGIYTIDQLPEAGRALIKREADLHRVEADHLLDKINATATEPFKDTPLGSSVGDPRVPELLKLIAKKYHDGNIDLQIVGAGEMDAKLSFVEQFSCNPSGNDRRIVIFKQGEVFKPLTSSPLQSNVTLTRTFYLEQKTDWGIVKAAAKTLFSRKRRKAQKMTDAALVAKVESLHADTASNRNVDKSEYAKELRKRTDSRLERPLQGTETLKQNVKEKYRAVRYGPNAYMEDSLEKLCVMMDALLNGNWAPRNPITSRQKNQIREAYNKKLMTGPFQPGATNTHPRIQISESQLEAGMRAGALNNARAALPDTEPVRLIPKVPVVKPLCSVTTINEISTQFDQFFDEAKLHPENEFIKNASSSIKKARHSFHTAIKEGDAVKLRKAMAKALDAINAFGDQPAIPDNRATAYALAVGISNQLGGVAINADSFIKTNSPELLNYHRKNLIDFGMTDVDVDRFFEREKTLEIGLAKNAALKQARGSLGDDNRETLQLRADDLNRQTTALITTAAAEAGRLTLQETDLKNVLIAETSLSDAERNIARAAVSNYRTPRAIEDEIRQTKSLMQQQNVALANLKTERDLVLMKMEVLSQNLTAETLNTENRAILREQANLARMRRLAQREEHQSPTNIVEFIECLRQFQQPVPVQAAPNQPN